MNYFKLNYNRLENLRQINFYKIVIILCVSILILLFISCYMYSYKTISVYGYYLDGILNIKINNKLSDKIKNEKYLTFNNQDTTYQVDSFGEYEIINNEIYQNISLKTDDNFYNNEIGLVKIKYDKKKIITYILDLFK